jgi:hypothetical protein
MRVGFRLRVISQLPVSTTQTDHNWLFKPASCRYLRLSLVLILPEKSLYEITITKKKRLNKKMTTTNVAATATNHKQNKLMRAMGQADFKLDQIKNSFFHLWPLVNQIGEVAGVFAYFPDFPHDKIDMLAALLVGYTFEETNVFSAWSTVLELLADFV